MIFAPCQPVDSFSEGLGVVQGVILLENLTKHLLFVFRDVKKNFGFS